MELTLPHILLFSLTEAILIFHLQLLPSLLRTLTLSVLAFTSINSIIYLTYHHLIYPIFLSPLRHLPQPPHRSYPLLNHGLIVLKRPPGEEHLDFMKETHNDGLIYFRGFFNSERLLVTSPQALADVLVHKSYDFEKPSWARMFLRQFLGDGLLMTEGEEHRHQRKTIGPAFSFRNIKELYPVFWGKSIELCQVVKAELMSRPPADKVLEIGHFSTQVTMDIIGLAGLGRDVGTLRNNKDGEEDDELIKNYEELLEPSAEKAIYFVLHILFPQWLIKALPWKLNQRVKVITTNLKNICGDFVREKKRDMKGRSESEDSKDILSIMLRSNNFSDDNIVDQLLTFLAAGHETTSSTLTWATHLLSTHPEVQSRLRTEIHTYIPSPSAFSALPATEISSILESMPYLNAVCNEVLRLYPTIPITARVSTRPTTIVNQFIPKNTSLFIIPWAVNRNPKLWGPDSESFVPDRWIDSATGRATMNGGADSNYAFLTFLHGSRSCIGEKFARAELRALLAAFVGSFAMEMADPREKITVGGTITSKPVQGMRLRLDFVEWGGQQQ